MSQAVGSRQPQDVLLAEVVVDFAREEVRTKGGARIPLRPKSFAVLRALCARPGRLVTKDDLLRDVWRDATVSEESLTQCIADIRRALNDKRHEIVRTVPRRGYILDGPIATGSEANPAAQPAGIDGGSSTVGDVPSTRYAKSGHHYIAYQVCGTGPVDLVFVQGYITHLELEWDDPRPAQFYRRLASFSRLIRFDKRGTGLSDRDGSLPTLEERMDDVRAVMDAVGSKRAILLGSSEGGPMSMLFAATYPERVSSLVLYGAMARAAWAEDCPWGRTEEQLQLGLKIVDEKWGSGHSVDIFAPSIAHISEYRAWRARVDRAGASPGAVMALFRMNHGIDVRHLLSSIRVPTLVLHRTGDVPVSVQHGRYLAQRIPNARFAELRGADHAPWAGDSEAVCREIEAFAVLGSEGQAQDRVLVTLLLVIIRSKSPVTPALEQQCRNIFLRHIEQFRGRQVSAQRCDLSATFDGPGRAVRCARAIIRALQSLGLQSSAGLHTGELDIRGDELDGFALRIGEAVVSRAAPGEVLTTRTVVDLVAGSGLQFEPRGKNCLENVSGDWEILAAVSD